MRYTLVAVLLLIFSHEVLSQDFTNVSAVFRESRVFINYTLVGATDQSSYAVSVYGSHDSYAAPIKLATGSVGKNIKPGNHIITWDVRAELGNFKGEITFELRGTPEIIPLTVKNPATVRKGKNAMLEWNGGQKTVKLDVMKDDVVVSSLGERPNNGNFVWSVPKDMEKGSGYKLRVTSGSETAVGAPFAVKPKVPLLVKLSPLALLAIIPFLGGGDPPDNGGTTGGISDLPDSPGTP